MLISSDLIGRFGLLGEDKLVSQWLEKCEIALEKETPPAPPPSVPKPTVKWVSASRAVYHRLYLFLMSRLPEVAVDQAIRVLPGPMDSM